MSILFEQIILSLVNISSVSIRKLSLLFLWYALNFFKITRLISVRIFKGISSAFAHQSIYFFSLFSLTNLGPDLLVAVDSGFLYRISWDGVMHQHLTISLSALTYTNTLNSDRGLSDSSLQGQLHWKIYFSF